MHPVITLVLVTVGLAAFASPAIANCDREVSNVFSAGVVANPRMGLRHLEEDIAFFLRMYGPNSINAKRRNSVDQFVEERRRAVETARDSVEKNSAEVQYAQAQYAKCIVAHQDYDPNPAIRRARIEHQRTAQLGEAADREYLDRARTIEATRQSGVPAATSRDDPKVAGRGGS